MPVTHITVCNQTAISSLHITALSCLQQIRRSSSSRSPSCTCQYRCSIFHSLPLRPMPPSGWSNFPPDAEDTFFFSLEEIEDYRRDKRRRLIDRGREERMRATLEREGKNDTADDSDVWGGMTKKCVYRPPSMLPRVTSHPSRTRSSCDRQRYISCHRSTLRSWRCVFWKTTTQTSGLHFLAPLVASMEHC